MDFSMPSVAPLVGVWIETVKRCDDERRLLDKLQYWEDISCIGA
jgi:hypothetical protein